MAETKRKIYIESVYYSPEDIKISFIPGLFQWYTLLTELDSAKKKKQFTAIDALHRELVFPMLS